MFITSEEAEQGVNPMDINKGMRSYRFFFISYLSDGISKMVLCTAVKVLNFSTTEIINLKLSSNFLFL